ncbi:hypothetical protein A2U01_0112969, partial [Trifolium medium]|nr:hypothetical protein [Trifolium medium]
AATVTAAPFRPSQGGGFPPLFSIETLSSQTQETPFAGVWIFFH